jgi:hypothetical protein
MSNVHSRILQYVQNTSHTELQNSNKYIPMLASRYHKHNSTQSVYQHHTIAQISTHTPQNNAQNIASDTCLDACSNDRIADDPCKYTESLDEPQLQNTGDSVTVNY